MKYEVSFKNLSDIHMGSPYNSGTVKLSGDFVPPIFPRGFQDRYAVSDDGQICFLVEWTNVVDPSFRIWKIDAHQKNVTKSHIIPGCCERIAYCDGLIKINAWKYDQGIKTYVVSDFFLVPFDEEFDSLHFKHLQYRIKEYLGEDMKNNIYAWTRHKVESFLIGNLPGKTLGDPQVQSMLKGLEQEGLIRIVGRDDRYLESTT